MLVVLITVGNHAGSFMLLFEDINSRDFWSFLKSGKMKLIVGMWLSLRLRKMVLEFVSLVYASFTTITHVKTLSGCPGAGVFYLFYCVGNKRKAFVSPNNENSEPKCLNER